MRTWAIVGLVVYGVAASAILLAPVSYGDIIDSISEALRGLTGTAFGSGWIEFAANIALFAPIGFLFTLLFRNPWFGGILGTVVSVGAEIAQVIIPHRQPTLRDIISNGVGAAIGALVAWLIVLHQARKTAQAAQLTAQTDAARSIPSRRSGGGHSEHGTLGR